MTRTHTHVLIAGSTFTGKSYLARELVANIYRPRGVGIIVLDPTESPEWGADFQTTDPEAFLNCAQRSWACALFVDEAPSVIGRYNDQMHWCATTARHLGHRAHFIAQRPTALAPVVRDQCSLWYLFRVTRRTARGLAEESGLDQVEEAASLGNFEYLAVDMLARTVKRKGP